MSTYAYEAVNAAGRSSTGAIEVTSQHEAVRRIKEMGLFPTRVTERRQRLLPPRAQPAAIPRNRFQITIFEPRIKPAFITTFTRQIATLVDAGLPLLRGLKILEQQETHPTLKRIVGELSGSIEAGSTFSDALQQHPKAFNRFYVNMVRAGEAGGAMEISLRRLADFMEKALKIKNKVKAAMFYPAAVLFVAVGVIALMTVFVIPRFKEVFAGLTNGASLPAFTNFVMSISDAVRHHALAVSLVITGTFGLFLLLIQTKFGRFLFDQLKLKLPLVGPVFRKSAIARFSRTLGTLLSSGVPILQALQLVRETTGNVVVSRLVNQIHDGVKEGESITGPLRASSVFPPMVVGMVDIGEQTGALPDMLLKIADGCDDEVDNAVSAMTSVLEPILIVFLAVVVGSIVIAMFLPLISIMTGPGIGSNDSGDA